MSQIDVVTAAIEDMAGRLSGIGPGTRDRLQAAMHGAARPYAQSDAAVAAAAEKGEGRS